jgi:hypothetical protein
MSTTHCKVALLVLFTPALKPVMHHYWHSIAITMALSWFDASNIMLLTNGFVLFGHAVRYKPMWLKWHCSMWMLVPSMLLVAVTMLLLQ